MDDHLQSNFTRFTTSSHTTAYIPQQHHFIDSASNGASMIVPPSDALLSANPHFANLYTHLTTHILTPSGLKTPHTPIPDHTKKQLIKDQLLLKALEDLDLPHLQTTIQTIVSYISLSNSPLPSDTLTLLAPEIALFRAHLPEIAQTLESYLTKIQQSLDALEISEIASSLDGLREERQTVLMGLSASYSRYLDGHVRELEGMIREMEFEKHGTEARFTSARATYLNNVARRVELKATLKRAEGEKMMGREVVRFEEEFERLQVEEMRLVKRERDLETLLSEYGEQWGMFRALGEKYAEVEGDIEVVKREIEDLETQVWRGR